MFPPDHEEFIPFFVVQLTGDPALTVSEGVR
jgi:hypothetical protein